MALLIFKRSRQELSKALPSTELLLSLFKKLQGIMTSTAVNAAKNGMRLSRLTTQIKEVSLNLSNISKSTHELKTSIDSTAQFAMDSATGAEKVRSLVESNSEKCTEASKSAEAMQKQMKETDERLNALMQKVQHITEVSKVVQEIALETKLLAFNASIEAARAGEHGHGFKAVAEHIQKLATNTNQQTQQIFDLLAAVDRELEPSRKAISESNGLALKTSDQTRQVQESFAEISELVRNAADSVSRIATTSQQQKSSIDEIAQGLSAADSSIRIVRTESDEVNAGTFSLSAMVEDAYLIFGQADTQTTFHQMLQKARLFSGQCERVFEAAIDSGRVTLQDVLALDYREIKGVEIQKLSRLFDVSRVPVAGFDPPKYFTRYDQLVDLELQKLSDDLREADQRIVFGLVFDLNAYTPIHHKTSMQAWTGVREKDLGGNRIKRFFLDNNVLVRGARVGLSKALIDLPNMSARTAFHSVGSSELTQTPHAQDTYLVQTYARDTGAILTTLTLPIFVKGQRFGAVAIGWSPES